MSATGNSNVGAEAQLTQVDFVRWLIQPTTTHSPSPSYGPRDKQSMANSGKQSDAPVVTSSEKTTNDAEKPTKQISCVQCQTRKIKCDKVKPSCTHCIKSKIGPCEYRPPAPPRRGKRKPTEADLLLRLRKCEDLLRDSGIQVDENGNVNDEEQSSSIRGDSEPPAKKRLLPTEQSNGSASTSSSATKNPRENQILVAGRIIVEEGGSRYVDSDLWRGIGAETNQAVTSRYDPRDTPINGSMPLLLAPGCGEFLLETNGTTATLSSLHPSPSDAAILWNAFVENVEPLMKIIHVPTFETELWDACRSVEAIPGPMEALMFAIYTIAVLSLPEAQCERSLGVTKSVLLARFDSAVKKAFVKAGLLVSSDFRLVQAMVIWLHSIRDTYHPHALWILSGVTIRMAQRAGIHREKALASFPVFEAEMRRRTWWGLMAIESRAAELSGTGMSVFHNAHDTEVPRNLNDRDLFPDMKELPPSRTGATDMIFCALRFEVGKFFKENLPRENNNETTTLVPVLTDARIDEFEQILEHKYLRFCDALYPLHYITSIVGRACVGTMRLILHHPCQHPDGAKDMTLEEKQSLHQLSMKLVKYQHLINSTPAMSSRYLWHCDAYFPWHAFIYIITTICKVGDKNQAMESWELVQKTFEIFPKMITDTQRPLHIALGNLVMKAWDATGHWFPTEKTVRTPGMTPKSPDSPYQSSSALLPDFIIKLRAQRAPQIMPRYPDQLLGVEPDSNSHPPLSLPTTPGILAQNASLRYNGIINNSNGTVNNGILNNSNMNTGLLAEQHYPGKTDADVLPFETVDFSPEAWADWDKLLAASQTMEFAPDFQSTGNWQMYTGLGQ